MISCAVSELYHTTILHCPESLVACSVFGCLEYHRQDLRLEIIYIYGKHWHGKHGSVRAPERKSHGIDYQSLDAVRRAVSHYFCVPWRAFVSTCIRE